MIDDDGNARVCDFGLVRIIAEYGDTGLTTTTAYTGTARYLSYELVESDDTKLPTPASDVHALACVGLVVRPSVRGVKQYPELCPVPLSNRSVRGAAR